MFILSLFKRSEGVQGKMFLLHYIRNWFLDIAFDKQHKQTRKFSESSMLKGRIFVGYQMSLDVELETFDKTFQFTIDRTYLISVLFELLATTLTWFSFFTVRRLFGEYRHLAPIVYSLHIYFYLVIAHGISNMEYWAFLFKLWDIRQSKYDNK